MRRVSGASGLGRKCLWLPVGPCIHVKPELSLSAYRAEGRAGENVLLTQVELMLGLLRLLVLSRRGAVHHPMSCVRHEPASRVTPSADGPKAKLGGCRGSLSPGAWGRPRVRSSFGAGESLLDQPAPRTSCKVWLGLRGAVASRTFLLSLGWQHRVRHPGREQALQVPVAFLSSVGLTLCSVRSAVSLGFLFPSLTSSFFSAALTPAKWSTGHLRSDPQFLLHALLFCYSYACT